MKLTKAKLKSLILEVLKEYKKDLEDMEFDEFIIHVETTGNQKYYEIFLRNKETGDDYGRVVLQILDRHAVMHIDVDQEVAKGYGPLLTDFAMQLATQGHDVPLFPNVTVNPEYGDTSKGTAAMWAKYYGSRIDVENISALEYFPDLSDEEKQKTQELPEQLQYGYMWRGKNIYQELLDKDIITFGDIS